MFSIRVEVHSLTKTVTRSKIKITPATTEQLKKKKKFR